MPIIRILIQTKYGIRTHTFVLFLAVLKDRLVKLQRAKALPWCHFRDLPAVTAFWVHGDLRHSMHCIFAAVQQTIVAGVDESPQLPLVLRLSLGS